MIRTIVGSSLIVLVSSAALAQTPEPQFSFDAASLKPTQTRDEPGLIRRMLQGGPGSTDPGQFTYSNVTLKILVQMAYDLKEYQVSGPDWMDSTGFDLIAKMPRGTTQEQAARMMQSLLAERFHLVFHRETKPMQVYALALGKGGSKMKEVEVPTLSPDAPPPGPGKMGSGPGVRMMMSPNGLRLTGYMTMRQLTDMLTRRLEHPVLDETELKKTYDVDITWMPDNIDSALAHAGGGGHAGPAAGGGEAPGGASQPTETLAQALQEKLGLKLETRKSNAEILIVDRADKVPVEN